MRSASTTQFGLCSAIILFSTACSKGPGFGPGLNEDGSSLAALMEANVENARQHFQVDAAAGGSITGTKGVQVTFGTNAFRNASGTSVIGMVDVSLVEVMDIGDMIWLNTPTVGNDNGTLRVLQSGGAVYISARQGGNELLLGPQGMRIIVPTVDPDPDMGVFVADRTLGADLVWEPSPSATIDSVIIETLGGFQYAYALQVDSMQWINCDFFPYSLNNTTLTAITTADVPNDSTLVWFVFPTINAVTSSYGSMPHTFGFSEVPVGLQAVAVGLTREGAFYRSAFTSFTTSAGGSAGLSFQPTTLQAFEAAVDAL